MITDREMAEGQPAAPPAGLRPGRPRGPLAARGPLSGGAAERDARREGDHQRRQGLPLCPAAATIQSRIPTCRAVTSTSSYVAKTPTATELNANEIANTWKEPSVRCNSWSRTTRARTVRIRAHSGSRDRRRLRTVAVGARHPGGGPFPMSETADRVECGPEARRLVERTTPYTKNRRRYGVEAISAGGAIHVTCSQNHVTRPKLRSNTVGMVFRLRAGAPLVCATATAPNASPPVVP
ncbi:hypothetical protein GCM10010515_28980 [Streptomyces fructofermentans]|uniref:Uncharacterized protein n=1 Tax=Streptomyces fructofermentans TaxID=152141 RepID=A0A918KFM4_9ACTN|nr:hypothetical protein GCM10010515_28980 [Streptomyces fructofermentans]